MIYLKTGIGIELRGADMLISSLQSNFSGKTFTHFKRFSDYRLRNKRDLRQEINTFFRSNRLSKEDIVLGIPRSDIVIRHLDLPAEVADNLKQVIEYQVQSLEPVEEDRFCYDYVLFDGKETKKRLAILLVMVRKTVLDEHLGYLQDLGIKPAAVTAGALALSNIFFQNRKDFQNKTFILADAGPQSLDLMALHQGTLAFSREVPKEDIRSWGDLILLEVDEAASRIRLGPESTIEKIVLAGESSGSAYEQIKTVIPECDLAGNYLACKTPPENKGHLQEAASSIGLAYTGMARHPLIKVNLLPAERKSHQARWAYATAALLGLAIVLLLISLGFHEMAQQRLLSDALDREIAKLQTPIKRVQALRARTETMEKKIASIEDVLGKRDMNLEVLRELTTILPTDTYLTTYSNRDGTIQISGKSGSPSDLVPKLEESPLLKEVVQKGATFKDPRSGKYNFSFQMKLER